MLKCTFFFSCGSFWLWFLTCLRNELGSVYRLLHPGTEQAYGFWNEKVNNWITKITLINLKYFYQILLCWHHKHVSIDPARCVIDSWHTNVRMFFLPLMKYSMVSVFFCWYDETKIFARHEINWWLLKKLQPILICFLQNRPNQLPFLVYSMRTISNFQI